MFITADQLTINPSGTLVSDSVNSGAPIIANLNRLNVSSGGTMRAVDGVWGGDIIVQPISTLFVLNQGIIRAGSGDFGGNITIQSSVLAMPSNFTVGATAAGQGQVLAGNNTNALLGRGGTTLINVRDISVSLATTDAVVRGGDTRNPCERGGDVRLEAYNLFSVQGTNQFAGPNVKAGNNTAPVPMRAGGDVYLLSQNQGFSFSGSLVQTGFPFAVIAPCGVPGPERSCIIRTVAGTDTKQGRGESDCYRWDPPDLILEGDAQIVSCVVEIGAQNLIARNLNPALAPAVSAAERLDIFIPPGGTLDFSQLTPGVNWFNSPNGITIHADPASILLPLGTTLANFMSPPPTVLPGAFLRTICASPSGGFSQVRAGESRVIPLRAMNCGSSTEAFTMTVTDTRGWLTPFSQTTTLSPAQTIDYAAMLTVPANAGHGAHTVLTLDVRTVNSPVVQQTIQITYAVPGTLCDADFDGDGDVTSADFFSFIVAFLNGDEDGDFNNDGDVNSADFFAFLQAFFTPC